MPEDLDAIAARLFTGVLAPLVLGGDMRPGHAIGSRAALALADLPAAAVDPELAARVHHARVRRARTLVPIDDIDSPTGAEWALAAALHDILQSANPGFDSAFRRRSAARVLDFAEATMERVTPPANARQALSRHTWFARALQIARTDTVVSWWTGSRTFLGVEPPQRLKAWPSLRRVHVERTPRPLLKLAPVAHGDRLGDVVAKFLSRDPLTDFATCARTVPAFGWGPATAGLVATKAGQTLVLRALARLPREDVDAALGRATREALERRREYVGPALALLAEQSLARASDRVASSRPTAPGTATAAASFARALGAAMASRGLVSEPAGWPVRERRRLLATLESEAREGEAALRSCSNPP